jgi:acylphosphatase
MHLFVEGRVQGVGFRDTVYHQATAGGMSAWVLPQHATCPKAHQSRVH